MEEEKYMWYDIFENAYTKTRDENAPPERYLLTFRGSDDYVYKECWDVGNGKVIDIAYSVRQYDSGECVYVLNNVAKAHNVDLKKRIYWVIPTDRYDEYEKRFGINDD